VKYNKKGTNLQGNINTIIRKMVGTEEKDLPCERNQNGFAISP